MNGYPDGTFGPDNTITRVEVAAALTRLLGLEPENSRAGWHFYDVPASHWAAGYVGQMAEMGIIRGYGDGTFGPNDPVLYEQAVTMVIRAMRNDSAAERRGGYPDGYLGVAIDLGVTGKAPGALGAPASRGTVAQLLYNADRCLRGENVADEAYMIAELFNWSCWQLQTGPGVEDFYRMQFRLDGTYSYFDASDNHYSGTYHFDGNVLTLNGGPEMNGVLHWDGTKFYDVSGHTIGESGEVWYNSMIRDANNSYETMLETVSG